MNLSDPYVALLIIVFAVAWLEVSGHVVRASRIVLKYRRERARRAVATAQLERILAPYRAGDRVA